MPGETPNQDPAQNLDPQNQNNQNPDPSQNQNPDPATTNSEFENLIRTTLAESEQRSRAAEQRARDLEDQLNQMRNSQSQSQLQNQNNQNNPDPQQFWTNPVDSINNLIQRQIAPLNEFTQQIALQNQYTSLKNQYRAQPGFTQIESLVDQFMTGQPATHANMQIAIQRSIGQLVMTNPGLLTQNQNQNQNNNSNGGDPSVVGNIPSNQRPTQQQAHMRPSQNSQRTTVQDQKHRALTENERRVCREMNITEEKYWEMMDKPNSVTSWIPDKKGAK